MIHIPYNVTKVIIPDGVQLKRLSFSGSFSERRSLKEVKFPKNIIDMNNAFSNCISLISHPVCGDRVINMDRAYYNCSNLTGSPVCGKNVTTMDETYRNCSNLIGSPVCGKNVVDMSGAYVGCDNLTGSPVCGQNVTNMVMTYAGCYKITGSPVCGINVTNMYCTYQYCHNLTGSPVCGSNVTNMYCTYQYCHNLTGSPVCGSNVTNMWSTYDSCTNLTGSPVCGSNVTGMAYAYRNCYNLTGSPVCGEKVTNMHSTYSGCSNIGPNGYFYSNNITNMTNCFFNRNNSICINLYLPANSNTLNSALVGSIYSMIGKQITWTDDVIANGCYYNSKENIRIYPVYNVETVYLLHQNGGIHIESIEDTTININTTKTYNIPYLIADNSTTPQISITSSAENIVSVSNIVKNYYNIEFTLNTYNIEGSAIITIIITQGETTETRSFTATVKEMVTAYSVEAIDGVTYGFTLNDAGYYESGNKGVNSSYALCKVNITSNGTSNTYLDCINYAESNYDYGILSNIDITLTLSNTADKTNVFKSFKGSQSASVQTVDYGVIPEGEHFIYVKFVKDSSQASNNDSLQFKVRFE